MLRFAGTLALTVLLYAQGALAGPLPPGFVDIKVGTGWTEATGLCFAAPGGVTSGRMFVWEKAGRVWSVENGIRSAVPLIDINDEVGNFGDFGMVGFAVDPNFSSNGYIYLLYVVDYYYLIYSGTQLYNPASNIYNHDTIGRLTRYTARLSDGFHSVDPASRLVLLGESITTGIPIHHLSHGVGALLFSPDGTLLVSCGDGASFETTDTGGPISSSSNTALSDGIITLTEDVGAFRAQLVDSHSGKILRIDPATGDGVPSNPFYDPLAPRAPRSRVWALGLRNPYRMCIRPGTAGADPAEGRPGVIYFGDVGWATWEDMNVCTGPGQNFGWPLFEGIEPCPNYQAAETLNLDAPNPLYGGECVLPCFRFKDLCIQASLSPAWPNPCDGSFAIPQEVPVFTQKLPTLDWRHLTGPARTPVLDASGVSAVTLGTAGCPVSGESFSGNCSTGGLWYTGTDFPAEFQNSYFFADFGEGWIKNAAFDADQAPIDVRPFLAAGTNHICCLATSPVTGQLFYICFTATNASEVHQIVYFGGNNQPPTAVARATPWYGQIPLTVQFDASASTDPEDLPLAYDWDFGDGSPHSSMPNPMHVYAAEDDVTSLGTVVAKIYSLNPPHPTGNGSQDVEVMRDGDLPPAGTTDPLRQYDTSHNGQQGSSDWIGYTFSEPHQFVSMVYQEGARDDVGGWWSGISVQYFDGTAWQHVPGISSDPPFVTGKSGPGFRTYRFTFSPTTTTGLRIIGNIFSAKFVSVGELRVFTTDQASTAPRCHTATLTVTDALGAQDTAQVAVSLNNTPPQVTITSPQDGALYSLWRSYEVPLTAAITDAEQGSGQLSCVWDTIIHHNNHTHTQPPDPNCSTVTTVTTHGDDCHDYYYEFRLTVSDPACLSTTASVFMYPNCCRPDFNNDGFLDPLDYNLFINAFEGGDIAADYNADTFLDPLDYNAFINDFEAGC